MTSSPHLQVAAVAFDLLTALIDSWTLWCDAAGDESLGWSWRTASLRLVTSAGTYRPYENLVGEAAAEVGLPLQRATDLLERWGELRPWPDVPLVLTALANRRLAVLSNCSQRLAEQAATATGGRFELVMSAERAGVYKTDPRAYQALLDQLGLDPSQVLFVAGSAHDVPGAGALGMPVYWSNRQRLALPAGPAPICDAPDLGELLTVLT
jgi:2-haloacid dehalogenase